MANRALLFVSVALVLSVLVLSTMSFNTSPDTKYNWDNHVNADDLFVTLTNEPQVIFVVFFFKKVANNAELDKANDSLRNLLKNELVGYDEVTYTEVDLSPDKDRCTTPQGAPPCTTYTKLATERMGIDVNLLDVSPVVVVMKEGKN